MARESNRLESLWSGDFGDAYVERNRQAGQHRAGFWRTVLGDLEGPERVLEVGCNVGANLRWIAPEPGVRIAAGVDVNESALGMLGQDAPRARGVLGAARALPFANGTFDLVFTMGVLIHQPEESLGEVMDEMVRCSRKYVFCGEYFAEQTVEVPYRGQTAALFRRDYGGLLQARAPRLQLVKRGFLGRDTGWDDVTYWLFRAS